MRRVSFILLLTLILSGCKNGADGMDGAIQLRYRIMNAPKTSVRCLISADYGQEVYAFQMDCNFDSAGNMQFTVLAPESISDISGTIDAQQANIIFDDQVLAFPLMADGYISPISSPWFFMKTLRSGYIESCVAYEDGYCITAKDSFEDKPLQLEIYTDKEFKPYHTDFLWNGRRILSIHHDDFQCM